MMIPAAKALFLLSVFTFLGTHARTLPEDMFKISNTNSGLTSSIASINPPTHPLVTVTCVTENEPNKIIKMPSFIGKTHGPPPPAPNVAPPHDQANAFHRYWTSIFFTRGTTLEPSHLSQKVPDARAQLRSLSYVTENSKDDEIVRRPKLEPPPPPHLAPPHIQMKIYATE